MLKYIFLITGAIVCSLGSPAEAGKVKGGKLIGPMDQYVTRQSPAKVETKPAGTRKAKNKLRFQIRETRPSAPLKMSAETLRYVSAISCGTTVGLTSMQRAWLSKIQ